MLWLGGAHCLGARTPTECLFNRLSSDYRTSELVIDYRLETDDALSRLGLRDRQALRELEQENNYRALSGLLVGGEVPTSAGYWANRRPLDQPVSTDTELGLTPRVRLQRLLALADIQGVNFRSLHKGLSSGSLYQAYAAAEREVSLDPSQANRTRRNDAYFAWLKEVEGQLADAINTNARKMRELGDKILADAQGRGIEADRDDVHRVLRDLVGYGYSVPELVRLKNHFNFNKKQWNAAESRGKKFWEFLRDRIVELADPIEPSLGDIRIEGLEGPPRMESDKQSVVRAETNANRSRNHGHTLNVDDYVERHFSPHVLDLLDHRPEMKVKIYGVRPAHFLGQLRAEGYKRIQPLYKNEYTDFRAYLVSKGKGEVDLVILHEPGASYAQEIASHFLYLSDPLGKPRYDPDRIEVYRDPTYSAKDQMLEVLRTERLDPDIIIMGNVEQNKRIFGSGSGGVTAKPLGTVAVGSLYGVIYEINGRQVLNLKVEPYLYAGRAGAFVEALRELSDKDRQIIFTGTAGALDPRMQVGDMVVPSKLHDANTLTPRLAGEGNKAVDVIRAMEYEGTHQGIFVGDPYRHGSVDSILFEDRAWVQQYRNFSIVEQEVASLIEASRDRDGTGKIDVYAIFRISDNLATGESFTENESSRPPPRTPIVQGDVVTRIVANLTRTELTGEKSQWAPPPDKAFETVSNGFEVAETPEGRIAWTIPGLESIGVLYPGDRGAITEGSIQGEMATVLHHHNLKTAEGRAAAEIEMRAMLRQRHGLELKTEMLPPPKKRKPRP